MNQTRANKHPEQTTLNNSQQLDINFPFNDSLSPEAYAQVKADWDLIETKTKRGKAFNLGMSLEQYEQHLLKQKQLTNQPQNPVTARFSSKKN